MSRMSMKFQLWPMVSAWLLALMLAACGSPAKRTVVVEDRPVGRASPGSVPSAATMKPGAGEGVAAVSSGVPSSGDTASNAGKPGFYTVKPGDTLVRIGLDHGQNWRDIARWNQIENANLIEVGQVLRVRPEPQPVRPMVRPADRADRAVVPGSAAPSSPAPTASTSAPMRPSGSAVPSAGDPSRESATEPASAEVNWAWPAAGAVLQGFDEQRNKGLDIGGKAGDPVFAAADGRVVYAGSALRGYGNLVILKHNGTFLSAYAHNQTLLVKEDQVVKRGQKIAEMGNTDAERVQLHFEIRRDGKPVDPARYLPAR